MSWSTRAEPGATIGMALGMFVPQVIFRRLLIETKTHGRLAF